MTHAMDVTPLVSEKKKIIINARSSCNVNKNMEIRILHSRNLISEPNPILFKKPYFKHRRFLLLLQNYLIENKINQLSLQNETSCVNHFAFCLIFSTGK